jgi:insulysin
MVMLFGSHSSTKFLTALYREPNSIQRRTSTPRYVRPQASNFPKLTTSLQYLAKNGGSSNAFTAASNTNYYFKVNTDSFAGALDRFSGFFHSPLFSPSCTLRELNAVDSENKKNLQHDMWRIFQLNKHLSKPGHPWVKFGTGNKKTLTEAARSVRAAQVKANAASKLTPSGASSGSGSALPTPTPSRVASPAPSAISAASDDDADGGAVGRETRRRLIEWWSKEYCASRMSLVVVAKGACCM